MEVRLVECLGRPGAARLEFGLPHESASLTDAMGRQKSALTGSGKYVFSVRPQQIVTLHFQTVTNVPLPPPIEAWDSFAPQDKRGALRAYDPDLISHPPSGS